MIIREKYPEGFDPRRLAALGQGRGWSYVISWAHRVSGLFLLLYVLLHIYNLSSLTQLEVFAGRMELLSGPGFVFMEWLLAVPVIFHCLNGGRLLVYEFFTTDYDELLRSWVIGLSAVYLMLLGFLMVIGTQSVSPVFFWLLALVAGLIVTYPIALRIGRTQGSIFWKLQRLTATLLFVLVPAHMLFMHLNHSVGRDPQIITERLSLPLISVIDTILLLFVLYHGGYGLIGVMKDYLIQRRLLRTMSVVVILVLILFGVQGISLIRAF